MNNYARLPREPKRQKVEQKKEPQPCAAPSRPAEDAPDKQVLLMAALLSQANGRASAMLESLLPHIEQEAEREKLKRALRYGTDLRCSDGVQKLRVLSRCTRQSADVERLIARTQNLRRMMDTANKGNLLSALTGMMPMMGNAGNLLNLLRGMNRR